MTLEALRLKTKHGRNSPDGSVDERWPRGIRQRKQIAVQLEDVPHTLVDDRALAFAIRGSMTKIREFGGLRIAKRKTDCPQPLNFEPGQNRRCLPADAERAWAVNLLKNLRKIYGDGRHGSVSL